MSMTTGLLELLAELGRDLGDVDHRFRIVAVDVEDRRLDHLGDVGADRATSASGAGSS